MTINPKQYANRSDYLDACREREIRDGKDRDSAEYTRSMYEAVGEEWEGQYGGIYGF